MLASSPVAASIAVVSLLAMSSAVAVASILTVFPADWSLLQPETASAAPAIRIKARMHSSRTWAKKEAAERAGSLFSKVGTSAWEAPANYIAFVALASVALASVVAL